MSTGDATERDHLDALALLRDAARATAGGREPGALDGLLDDAAVARAASPTAASLARMYVFAARVGAATADAEPEDEPPGVWAWSRGLTVTVGWR